MTRDFQRSFKILSGFLSLLISASEKHFIQHPRKAVEGLVECVCRGGRGTKVVRLRDTKCFWDRAAADRLAGSQWNHRLGLKGGEGGHPCCS